MSYPYKIIYSSETDTICEEHIKQKNKPSLEIIPNIETDTIRIFEKTMCRSYIEVNILDILRYYCNKHHIYGSYLHTYLYDQDNPNYLAIPVDIIFTVFSKKSKNSYILSKLYLEVSDNKNMYTYISECIFRYFYNSMIEIFNIIDHKRDEIEIQLYEDKSNFYLGSRFSSEIIEEIKPYVSEKIVPVLCKMIQKTDTNKSNIYMHLFVLTEKDIIDLFPKIICDNFLDEISHNNLYYDFEHILIFIMKKFTTTAIHRS